MTVWRQIQIQNKKGLHARAAAKFVQIVDQFNAKVVVKNDIIEVPGNSLLGLLTLSASYKTFISIHATGKESQEVINALDILMRKKFYEDN